MSHRKDAFPPAGAAGSLPLSPAISQSPTGLGSRFRRLRIPVIVVGLIVGISSLLPDSPLFRAFHMCGILPASSGMSGPSIQSIMLNPSTVTGGMKSVATITLTGPAPSNGALVSISSSDTSLVNPFSSVTLEPGQTSATFSLYPNAVSSQSSAMIKATYGGSSTSATLTVIPPVLESLAIIPGRQIGACTTSNVVVYLNSVAPSGGALVGFSNTTPALNMPSSATVPAGANHVTFTVTSQEVTSEQDGSVRASFGGVSASYPTSVREVWSRTFGLNQNQVNGGNSVGGTVTLDCADMTRATTVYLQSDNDQAAIPAPSSFTIPAGSTSGNFTIDTMPVSSSTTVNIRSTVNGQVRIVQLTVNPTYIIGGQIAANGTPLANIGVSLSGSSSAATTTDGNGMYSFPGLTQDGSYTVQPSSSNYTFMPPNNTFNNLTSNQTQDFAAAINTFSVTGAIKDTNGNPLSGVALTLTGPQSETTQTGSSGTFDLGGLPAGNYMLTAIESGYSFSPTVSKFTLDSSQSGMNFTASSQAQPTPTPPLMFNGNSLLSEPPDALDTNVTESQMNGTFTIQPLTGAEGTHLNGFVSSPAEDMNDMRAEVDLKQAASGDGAETSFAVGTGDQYYYRFMVSSGGQQSRVKSETARKDGISIHPSASTTTQLIFQVASGNGTTEIASIDYNPVQDRFLRFRHDPTRAQGAPLGYMVFETSPCPATGACPPADLSTLPWTAQARVPIAKTINTLLVELSSGSVLLNARNSAVRAAVSTASGDDGTNPAPAIFDDFKLERNHIQSISLNPSTVTGGQKSLATVTIDGPAPPDGATVDISSDNTALVNPYSSVDISPGQTSATFSLYPNVVSSQSTAMISASYGGASTSATLTVIPPVLQSFAVIPGRQIGACTTSSAVAYLNSEAPNGGALVTLSNTNSALNVPANVTVPAGATHTSITITSQEVTSEQDGSVTASYGGVSISQPVTVRPVWSKSVTLSESEVKGGTTLSGTVTLDCVDMTRATTVLLTSNNPQVGNPSASSISIPSGRTSGNFTINTSMVSSTTSLSIKSTTNGLSRTAPLTVTPPAGHVDTSFGNNGFATTSSFLPGKNDQDTASQVAVQPDNKIVIVGSASNGTGSFFAIARFNAEGSLDTTFGSQGHVVTSFNGFDRATAVAIQTDKKIVVGGNTANSSGAATSSFALARFNPDGSPDSSFGTSGKVVDSVSTISGQEEISSVLIQTDGRIVAGGTAPVNASETGFAIARFNADGSVDSSFGSAGEVKTTFGVPTSFVSSVLLQNDMKIVAVGTAQSSTPRGYFALARYNSDGSPDSAFGNGGKVLTGLGSNSSAAYAGVLQSDDKIIAAGTSGGEFALLRYNTDGSLDTNFGSGGEVLTALPPPAVIQAVVVQGDGKIVASGIAHESGGNIELALARYNSDGSLDTGFGQDGITLISVSGVQSAAGLGLQSDGMIIAGFSPPFGLVRIVD